MLHIIICLLGSIPDGQICIMWYVCSLYITTYTELGTLVGYDKSDVRDHIFINFAECSSTMINALSQIQRRYHFSTASVSCTYKQKKKVPTIQTVDFVIRSFVCCDFNQLRATSDNDLATSISPPDGSRRSAEFSSPMSGRE